MAAELLPISSKASPVDVVNFAIPFASASARNPLSRAFTALKFPTLNGDALLLIGNNSADMKTYIVRQHKKPVPVQKDDAFALITRKNGTIFKQEFYYGSTYLSQSSRQLLLPDDVVSIEIFNMTGEGRKMPVNPN